jgi:DNA repair protein RadD
MSQLVLLPAQALTDSQPLPPREPSWLDALPPQAAVLRDYQTAVLAKLSTALHRGIQRSLVQAPTGAGKTHIIATIVAAAVLASMRVLVLATRTRLVRQIHERLESFEISHGVMAAALPGMSDRQSLVQVCSVDTLYRRCLVDERMPLPPADLVIFDEAHLALGESRQRLLMQFPNAWLIGFTATPAKISGRPLSAQFDVLVKGPSVLDLIARKMLVQPRIFAKPVMTEQELDGVAKDSKSGDYATGDLSALMSRPKLVGDVVQNWLRIANGKRTLVFACDKMHGAQLLTEFRQAGVAAEMLTDNDDEDTREGAIARLETGETRILVNCFLLSYGIDIPAVECIVLARPTRSVVLYLQAVGRGLRPSEGKDGCIVIDHGHVAENLGMPTQDFGWSLTDGNVNRDAREATKRVAAPERPRTCGECAAMWLVTEDGNNCPNCGWQPPQKRKPVNVTDAELHEYLPAADRVIAETFYREACGWWARRKAQQWQERPNSIRWLAWLSAKEKFKLAEDKMPSRWWSLPIYQPSFEVAGWLQSRLIRWAKGQQKARKQQAEHEARLL